MTETELGAVVVEYLKGLGWEVFQEVSTGPGGSPRADIVATKGGCVWIVELKKSFGFAVLSQANDWIKAGAAHMVSVATPIGRRGGTNAFRVEMAKHVGCGWLLVGQPYAGTYVMKHVEVAARPRLTRRLGRRTIARFLRPDHKTGLAAGSQGGGYWTPFRGTMRAVAEVVRESPGISLKALIERVDHHYASDRSARQSIAEWVRAGKCEGVEVRRVGRLLEFHPKTQQ